MLRHVFRLPKVTAMQFMPDADVITVNYNAGPLLTKSVASAFAAGAQKVVVVDNASNDGSIEHLELNIHSPKLVIVRNQENIGFASACNIGLQNSDAGTVLFLNPDALLSGQALSLMVEALYSASEIGMAGSLLCNLDGTEQAGGRRAFPTPSRAFIRAFNLSFLVKKMPRFLSGFELHALPVPADNIRVEAISGACMLVKRKAMIDVGNWDENYFLHCEDLDLCMRFKQAGWSVIFVPKAPVVHVKGICSNKRPIFVEWHKHRGMVRFYEKFFRLQYSNLLWYLVVFGVWVRFSAVCSLIALRSRTRMRSEEAAPANDHSLQSEFGLPEPVYRHYAEELT